MKEIVLEKKKNGMAVMLLVILYYIAAVALIIAGAVMGAVGFLANACIVLGIIIVSLGWIPLCGLKILKPQEALVLTC